MGIDEMLEKKNIKKGNSYSYAFSQMKRGIDQGFYIETIAIAESIIADRLQSFALGKGWKGIYKNGNLNIVLGNAIEGAKAKYGEEALTFSINILGKAFSTENLFEDLKTWKDKYRNKIIHQLAKSDPGEATIEIDNFLQLAKFGAEQGCKYARLVCAWHEKEKQSIS